MEYEMVKANFNHIFQLEMFLIILVLTRCSFGIITSNGCELCAICCGCIPVDIIVWTVNRELNEWKLYGDDDKRNPMDKNGDEDSGSDRFINGIIS